MSFDEFLSRRLTELTRFAYLLCGQLEHAEQLVTAVLVEAFPHWAVLSVDRPFPAVRGAIVRRYLDEAAARPVHATAGDGRGRAGGGDAPIDLDVLPPARRAVLVLSAYSGQTTAEIASVVRARLVEVDADLAAARGRLAMFAVSGDGDLIDGVESLADAVPEDHARIAHKILDRLESASTGASDAAVFADLFGQWGHAEPATPSAPLSPTYALADAASTEDAATASPAQVGEAQVAGDQDPDACASALGARGTARTVLRRVGGAVAIAAVAIAVSALVSHTRHASPSAAAARSVVPSRAATAAPTKAPSLVSPVGRPLPGTKILGQFYGSGSTTINGGRHTVSAGRELAVNAVCSGPGKASIGAIVLPECDGQPVGANITGAQLTTLRISADKSTTWRFAIADEPAQGTNGSLSFPAASLLTSASPVQTVAQAAGSGSTSVPLASGTTSARVQDVRLVLTCAGAGVSFASDDHRFDGLYTTTCFSGWSYEFDVSGALLPDMLSVRAAAATTWKLVVLRG